MEVLHGYDGVCWLLTFLSHGITIPLTSMRSREFSMTEYLCLACAEEFELDLDSGGLVRCPDCLSWKGAPKAGVYRILEAIFKEEHLEDA